jgi:hypothetical protein
MSSGPTYRVYDDPSEGTDNVANPYLDPADRAKLALELTMRDALSGLEELASLDVYWFEPGCLEILGIEPPTFRVTKVTALQPKPCVPAKILTFSEAQRRTG